ncbi:hypothetical protein BU16DRAFT_261331 [Lophium mytilinum]|uniref:NB-ARC domain-containing protein n=1 Tax=Lophium mytilinum TaxID=390894 RepID=A0A6A6R330_9PEZI|nr:hypothetical protein BU16DRAFT_261331 [Lophium mytilinum]
MADPLSIAASVLAVVGAAGKVLAGLHYIAEQRQGPQIFKDLYSRVRDIDRILTTIQEPLKQARDEPATRTALVELQRNIDQVAGILKDIDTLISKVQSGDGTSEPSISTRKWMLKQTTFKTRMESLRNAEIKLQTSLSSAMFSQIFSGTATQPIVPTVRSPVWTVPYRQDPDFIDRPDILSKLEQLLANPASRAALVGFGGVGKSQLAIEYAFRVQEKSPHTSVFWVYTATAERFEGAYREIADKLDIKGRHQAGTDIKRLVSIALSDDSYGEWLMVVDNADDLTLFDRTDPSSESLADYIPQSRHGRVLVTSRNKAAATSIVGRHQDVINVDEMSQDEAMSLLKTKLAITFDEDDASELLTALGNVPLALSHAAGYINEHTPHVNILEYLRMFKESDGGDLGLLEGERNDNRRDRHSSNAIATTLQMSFRHVEKASPLAADILRLMCYFDRQYIPTELILDPFISGHDDNNNDDTAGQALKEGTERLRECSPSRMSGPRRTLNQRWHSFGTKLKKRREKPRISIARAHAIGTPNKTLNPTSQQTFQASEVYTGLSTLVSYSLISLTTDGVAYSMHRLVQLAGRKWSMSQPATTLWPLKAGVSISNAFQHAYFDIDFPRIRTILPHTQMVLQDSLTVLGPKPARNQERNAQKYWKVRAQVLCGLTDYHLYHNPNRVSESEIRESNEIFNTIYGSHHVDTLWARHTLGTAIARENPHLALETFRELLETLQKYKIDDKALEAAVYNCIGNFLSKTGEFEEAKQSYQKAIDRGAKEYSDQFLAARNFALCDRDLGNFTEAEHRLKSVIAELETTFPESMYDLLSCKSALVGVLVQQGEYALAEQLGRPTLESMESIVGPDHPGTFLLKYQLGICLFKLRRYEEAFALSQQCLLARELLYGPVAKRTLMTIRWQGRISEAMWNYADAEQAYLRVAEGYEQVYGVEHKRTVAARKWLGVFQLKLEARELCTVGSYAEAERLYARTAEAEKKKWDADDPVSLDTIKDLESVRAKIREQAGNSSQLTIEASMHNTEAAPQIKPVGEHTGQAAAEVGQPRSDVPTVPPQDIPDSSQGPSSP